MADSLELLRLPDNKLIDCFRQAPLRSLRQIWCFAQAGGGAWEFSGWSRALKPGSLLCAVRLPGRERRFAEPFFTDVADTARSIATDIEALITADAVFYGQCLGALIAFEVAIELGRRGCVQPRHLFAASSPSPRHAEIAGAEKLAALDEAGFKEAARHNGSLPEGIDRSNGMLRLALTALRADFLLLGNYIPSSDRIGAEITTLTGADNKRLRPEDVADWRTYSSVGFKSATVPGELFLTRSAGNEALDVVQNYAG